MSFYALDSNTISYLLDRRLDVQRKLRELPKRDDILTIVIPPVVYYEVQRGLLYKDAKNKLRLFQQFCIKYDVGRMDWDCWNTAAGIYARLRKMGKLIEDADIQIAAFCLVNDMTLVTSNASHFSRIPELKWENWVSGGEHSHGHGI